uniref:MSP domain-containing protein n=1 Tax=Caenorhabditis tropicalis TaxID=1561998 RepID=A0A1I7TZI7_9PELO
MPSNTVADVASVPNDNILEKKNEEFVVIAIRDPESIQRQYAIAHQSTGKEITVFIGIFALIVLGFFAAAKLL